MTTHYRVARPADLGEIGPLLDQEFVFGKGRKTSLVQRFPSTFCAANVANIFLAEENGKIISVFLVKRFDWLQGEKIWNGAMIGAVYVLPKRRGEGIASNLLKWGIQTLKNAGVQFSVLWTSQPAFYTRLGWLPSDCGVLGNSDGSASGILPDTVTSLPLVLSNEREIDVIRSTSLDTYVIRQQLDYYQIPLPAENIDALLWMDEVETSSYALLGGIGETGILYEMVGNQYGFADLWAAIQCRHRKIIINDYKDGPSFRWLKQNTDIVWEDKELAMWLPLSSDLDIAILSQWYIPYFDRI